MRLHVSLALWICSRLLVRHCEGFRTAEKGTTTEVEQMPTVELLMARVASPGALAPTRARAELTETAPRGFVSSSLIARAHTLYALQTQARREVETLVRGREMPSATLAVVGMIPVVSFAACLFLCCRSPPRSNSGDKASSRESRRASHRISRAPKLGWQLNASTSNSTAQCSCGNIFMGDSVLCRKCGAIRQDQHIDQSDSSGAQSPRETDARGRKMKFAASSRSLNQAGGESGLRSEPPRTWSTRSPRVHTESPRSRVSGRPLLRAARTSEALEASPEGDADRSSCVNRPG